MEFDAAYKGDLSKDEKKSAIAEFVKSLTERQNDEDGVSYNKFMRTLSKCLRLEKVDLSTYGLERVKLNHTIGLDDSETEVDPQNPNPGGAHGGDVITDPLDDIIREFNERWFQGWSATPEEQRVKLIHLADSIKAHPDFEEKYQNNPDSTNREIAFAKIFEEVMLKNRQDELEIYKLLAGDESFKAAMQKSLQRVVSTSI